MLAVTGWIVADFIRLPGDVFSFENVPSSKDAHDILLTGPMVGLLMLVGLFDLTATGPGVALSMKGERDPGDFGLTMFAPKTEEGMKAAVNKELLVSYL